MKRNKYKIGDIFEVRLDDKKGYVQYVANDSTQLNSDVVRVFKERYSLQKDLGFDDILNGKVDIYIHVTGVEFGTEDGTWRFVGSGEIGDLESIWFRTPGDGPEKREDGLWYASPKISKSWYVWQIGGDQKFKERLSDEDASKTFPGDVVWPKSVREYMRTGEYQGFFPDYR